MPERHPPSPSETTTAGRGLSAMATNPVLGTTVPLGAAFFWLFNMVSTGNDQISEVKTGQAQIQIEMAKVTTAVESNSNGLAQRTSDVQALAATVQELKSDIAMIKRDVEDAKAKGVALEGRLANMEAKR